MHVCAFHVSEECVCVCVCVCEVMLKPRHHNSPPVWTQWTWTGVRLRSHWLWWCWSAALNFCWTACLVSERGEANRDLNTTGRTFYWCTLDERWLSRPDRNNKSHSHFHWAHSPSLWGLEPSTCRCLSPAGTRTSLRPRRAPAQTLRAGCPLWTGKCALSCVAHRPLQIKSTKEELLAQPEMKRRNFVL